MTNLAILFWFYNEPEICKNRLELIKNNNPLAKIYGLFGGDPKDLEDSVYYENLKPYLDDLYICPFTDQDWKWRHGDLVLLDWYEKRGTGFAWDSIVITQWDMLVFDSFERQFPNIKKGEIFLSGLRDLDAYIEGVWSWTREGSPDRYDYLTFLQYVKDKYNYATTPPPCCLFILEVFPRLFFEKYAKIENKELGFLEYKIPIYAEIFGMVVYKRDLGVCWVEPSEKYPLNARTEAIKKEYIEKQLETPHGWRIFHPYFEIW